MKLLERVIEEVESLEYDYKANEEIDGETRIREDLGFIDSQVQELIENVEYSLDVSLPLSEYNLHKKGVTLQDIVDAVVNEK
jgi:hypothetical protein